MTSDTSSQKITSPDTVTINVPRNVRDIIREKAGKEGVNYAEIVTRQFTQQEGKIGPLARNSGKEQGTIFITFNRTIYNAPAITVDTIKHMLETPYIASKLEKRLFTFFPVPVTVQVLDPDNNVDPDETQRIQKMTESKEVMLNERIIQAYQDSFCYGPGIFNPVWTRSRTYNEISLQKLRHLPAWSFDWPPDSQMHTWSPLLPGIILNEKGEPEYWQRTDMFTYETERIDNVFVVKNPLDEYLSGDSKIIKLASIIEMLKFVWNTGMQVVSQSGAAFFFIIVENPQPANEQNGYVSDIDFVDEILSKSSKDMRFQLRENMKPVQIDMKPGVDVLTYEVALKRIVDDFFDIAEQISKSKDGAIIGGSSRSELEIHNQAASGVHNWLLPQFENLLEQYFWLNGYPEGWRVWLTYQLPQPDRTEQKLKQAELLAKYQMGDIKTIYDLLPDVEPIDDARAAEILEYWANRRPPEPIQEEPAEFTQKAHTHKEDPIDPLAQEMTDALAEELDILAGKILKGLAA